eukprot:5690860-Ditylum_brightwellii.AAC.1
MSSHLFANMCSKHTNTDRDTQNSTEILTDAPSVTAKLLNISPNMIEYANATPAVVKQQDSETTHDDFDPISLVQRSPSDDGGDDVI